MPVYIEKEINGDVDRPANQPTDQQGKYRAIRLFESLKIEKKARDLQFSWKLSTNYAILSFIARVEIYTFLGGTKRT